MALVWGLMYTKVYHAIDMIKYKQLITNLLYFTKQLGYGLRTLNTLSQNWRTQITGLAYIYRIDPSCVFIWSKYYLVLKLKLFSLDDFCFTLWNVLTTVTLFWHLCFSFLFSLSSDYFMWNSFCLFGLLSYKKYFYNELNTVKNLIMY